MEEEQEKDGGQGLARRKFLKDHALLNVGKCPLEHMVSVAVSIGLCPGKEN